MGPALLAGSRQGSPSASRHDYAVSPAAIPACTPCFTLVHRAWPRIAAALICYTRVAVSSLSLFMTVRHSVVKDDFTAGNGINVHDALVTTTDRTLQDSTAESVQLICLLTVHSAGECPICSADRAHLRFC